MDYSKITLGELLSSQDEIIRRNAVSILKRYQKENILIEELPRVEIVGNNDDWDTGESATIYRIKTPNQNIVEFTDYKDNVHIEK